MLEIWNQAFMLICFDKKAPEKEKISDSESDKIYFRNNENIDHENKCQLPKQNLYHVNFVQVKYIK